MTDRRHALVLFTKYPEPGVTKTRLMQENGGTLTALEAAELYKAMVLDTATLGLYAVDCCRRNLQGEFIFCICSSPEEHMSRIQEMFSMALPGAAIEYIVDRGSNFDEHFNSCYSQLFENGYHAVICIGGDLPGLTPDLICRAFEWLSRFETDSGNGAMVLAPCQAAGVSLVGITREAGFDFRGVFYNPDGVPALDGLVRRAEQEGIPLALFEAVSDVDYGEDLAHAISIVNAMAYAARFQQGLLVPKRTLEFIRTTGLVTCSEPNESRDPRDLIDHADSLSPSLRMGRA
jgi:hypothetical protein